MGTGGERGVGDIPSVIPADVCKYLPHPCPNGGKGRSETAVTVRQLAVIMIGPA